MAFDFSDSSTAGRSRSFDFLNQPTPRFGQQAHAYRQRLAEEQSRREQDGSTGLPGLSSGGGMGAPSSEGTALLFGGQLQDQRNAGNFAMDALDGIGAVQDAARRAQAERAAAANRAAAQGQANTMGLVGAGLGVVGSIAGALI